MLSMDDRDGNQSVTSLSGWIQINPKKTYAEKSLPWVNGQVLMWGGSHGSLKDESRSTAPCSPSYVKWPGEGLKGGQKQRNDRVMRNALLELGILNWIMRTVGVQHVEITFLAFLLWLCKNQFKKPLSCFDWCNDSTAGFLFHLMLGPGERIFIPVSQHDGRLKSSKLIGKVPF